MESSAPTQSLPSLVATSKGESKRSGEEATVVRSDLTPHVPNLSLGNVLVAAMETKGDATTVSRSASSELPALLETQVPDDELKSDAMIIDSVAMLNEAMECGVAAVEQEAPSDVVATLKQPRENGTKISSTIPLSPQSLVHATNDDPATPNETETPVSSISLLGDATADATTLCQPVSINVEAPEGAVNEFHRVSSNPTSSSPPLSETSNEIIEETNETMAIAMAEPTPTLTNAPVPAVAAAAAAALVTPPPKLQSRRRKLPCVGRGGAAIPRKRPDRRKSRMQNEIHLSSRDENVSSNNGHHCIIHTPTLDELQRTTFSNYVRTVVLPAAAAPSVVVVHKTDRSGTARTPAAASVPGAALNAVAAEGFGSSTTGETIASSPIAVAAASVQPPAPLQPQPTSLGTKSNSIGTGTLLVGAETTAMELREGIAKIRLPKGFFVKPPYGDDTTGRGPIWQAGSALGDRVLQSPIRQNILGMTGVYEYTHALLPSTTLAEFRDRADKYRTIQMGSALLEFKANADDTTTDKKADVAQASHGESVEPESLESASDEAIGASVDHVADADIPASSSCPESTTAVTDAGELTPEQVASLERQFWRQLSPTMPPPVYGADEVGSLFGDDPATGWSLGNLDSCLHVLPDIPGVTSPYLYAGMWASVFCAHSEDMNLLSVNYLHAGSPKLWYTVAEPDAARFVSLAEHHFVHQVKQCKEFLRHKRCLLSPDILKAAGIRYQTAIQYPGDAIITFPGSYHFGFNAGFNIAEATNFGVPEWIPFGRRAKICLCRPDSVRIDMNKLTVLLQRFQKDSKRNRRLTWKEWRKRQERKEAAPTVSSIHETEDEIIEVISYAPKKRTRSGKKKQMSEQQLKNEYWIEVMRPSELTQKAAAAAAAPKKKRVKEASNPWHLAKPIGRKRLEVNAKVLCLVPAPPPQPVALSGNQSSATASLQAAGSVDHPNGLHHRRDDDVSSDDEVDAEEHEHCLAGSVIQIADGHVLVHFNGMNKSENKWYPLSSPKLFLDGGQWQEEHEQEGMPALHYWKEMDSKMLST